MKKSSGSTNNAARSSWQGRWLRDGFENRLGIVLRVEGEEEIILCARFQGETAERKISIEPRDDGEFVHPDLVRARYRLLSEEEAARLLRS